MRCHKAPLSLGLSFSQAQEEPGGAWKVSAWAPSEENRGIAGWPHTVASAWSGVMCCEERPIPTLKAAITQPNPSA